MCINVKFFCLTPIGEVTIFVKIMQFPLIDFELDQYGSKSFICNVKFTILCDYSICEDRAPLLY